MFQVVFFFVALNPFLDPSVPPFIPPAPFLKQEGGLTQCPYWFIPLMGSGCSASPSVLYHACRNTLSAQYPLLVSPMNVKGQRSSGVVQLELHMYISVYVHILNLYMFTYTYRKVRCSQSPYNYKYVEVRVCWLTIIPTPLARDWHTQTVTANTCRCLWINTHRAENTHTHTYHEENKNTSAQIYKGVQTRTRVLLLTRGCAASVQPWGKQMFFHELSLFRESSVNLRRGYSNPDAFRGTVHLKTGLYPTFTVFC